MAGNIFWKEQAVVTLSSTLAALVNNGGGAAGTNLDCRSAGNAAEMFGAVFELTVQWATVTSIAAGTAVADLFLVPSLDGTNFESVNIANASTDYISPNFLVDTFIAPLAPTANTNYLFGTRTIPLFPLLYKAYLINRSGQTFTANGTLKVVAAQGQYS